MNYKAPKTNPTIIFEDVGEEGGRVEFRKNGTSPQALSLVRINASGAATFYPLINNNGSRNWVSPSELTEVKESFQDGVDTLYNKCKSCGATPASSTPTAVANAIQRIHDDRYNAGYNAGKNSPVSAGTYKISFSGRMHPPGDGSNWINVSDAIYIRVTGSSVVIDTNYISIANGQVDLNVAKV